MSKSAKEITTKDITDRLDVITLHIEERSSLRLQLEKYCTHDNNPDSPKHEDLKRIRVRVQNEDIRSLYEIIHLLDNVKKYFKVFGLNNKELSVIENFKPYKVAANFVNVHKHGSRGRGKSSAKMDYYTDIYKQEGDKPGDPDTLIDTCGVINFEGVLYQATDIIGSLIQLWSLFLRNHTEIDIKAFVSRVNAIVAPRQGQTTYSAKLPEGMLADAKRQAEERKHINL